MSETKHTPRREPHTHYCRCGEIEDHLTHEHCALPIVLNACHDCAKEQGLYECSMPKLSQKDLAILDGFKIGLIGPDRAKEIVSELISFLQQHQQDEDEQTATSCQQVLELISKINRKLSGVA